MAAVSTGLGISLVPLASEGNLKITDGKMKPFWPMCATPCRWTWKTAACQSQQRLLLNLAKGTELLLSNTSQPQPPSRSKAPANKPLLRLANLDISDTSVDLIKQQVIVGKIRSQKLETWAAREADGQLDWRNCWPANRPSQLQLQPRLVPTQRQQKPSR